MSLAAASSFLADDLKMAVRSWVPKLRIELENEFAAQLAWLGLKSSGKHTPLDKMSLPAEAKAIRSRVEALIARD